MTELNLTSEQQAVLLPLIAQLDRAATKARQAEGRLCQGVTGDLSRDLFEALAEYETAWRTLWSAVGGRF